MDFKVGDEVVIKSWEEMAKECGVENGTVQTYKTFVKEMRYLCGAKAIITDLDDETVWLEFDKTNKKVIEENEKHYWGYDVQMIKPYKTPQEQIKELVKQIDELNKEKEKGEIL